MALILLPILPGIGNTINGARLWVRIGPVNFQPGEFGKICLVLFFAGYLSERRELLAVATRRIGPVGIPEMRHFGPVLAKTQDQPVKRLAGFRGYFNSGKALVRPLLANFDLGNFEIRAVGQNLIQHLRQNQRVNDMPAQLDRFRKHPQSLAKENDHAS